MAGAAGMMGGMGGQGGMWGMVASYAMAELDREKEDRKALFQGLLGAQDDNTWIMQHYPDFYSTPQVQTQSVANANPNAPVTSGYQASQALQKGLDNQAAMNRQNSEQEFERWKVGRQELEGAANREALLKIYGGGGQGRGSSLSYEDYQKMRLIAGS